MSQEFVIAKDGLPARPSGSWAREKLHYVEKYQQIFALSMKNRFPRRMYIDLLAGPGRCVDDEGEFKGSALLSRGALFTDRCFIEGDPEMASALRARLGPDSHDVIEGDANSAPLLDAVRARIPAGALSLAFVDNLGLTIPFSTIRTLTAGHKVDLLITVMVSDLTRNQGHALRGEAGHDARFDGFFGSPEWRSVAQQAKHRNKTPAETVADLLGFYEDQFKAIGYEHFAGARVPMKNSKQAELYRLFLVARSPKAVEFFRKIEAIDYRGQRGLRF